MVGLRPSAAPPLMHAWPETIVPLALRPLQATAARNALPGSKVRDWHLGAYPCGSFSTEEQGRTELPPAPHRKQARRQRSQPHARRGNLHEGSNGPLRSPPLLYSC